MSAIDDKYAVLGGANSFLGKPVIPESSTPDGIGAFRHYEFGSIYWSPSTGAHEVHGAIRGKWSALGWERSFLGYPITDESVTPDGVGRFNHFQGGSIYWTPSTGAHEVHGAIRARWSALGWERSKLGYPITDETATPTGLCRFNHFQHGSIYWSAATGAHETLSEVRVHFKVLTTPTVGLNQMLDAMQQVYLTAGIRVTLRTTENLTLPLLNDVDVGGCSGTTTTEQNQLFGNRNNVNNNEVVAYFVRSTVPPFNGCASHPAGRPGAVVAQGATQWTLGHEIGHVLGLSHVNNNDRLMTGNGTANITNPPPDLIAGEITTMDNSALTINL
ncbi:MAG: hypothetical protein KDE19_18780 [Caldilineaceae bacterium]|nr:hypothetical protein [Caldilineaceae bacterium]